MITPNYPNGGGKKTRSKKPEMPAINNRDEAEEIMSQLAKNANMLRQLVAERDELIIGITDRFANGVATLEQQIKAKSSLLADWINANPGEFPKGKKTLELANGTISQRTSTPALKLLRGWSWERVLGAVMSTLPSFVRSKPEVDKEAIIAQREELEALGVLEKIGVKVDQGEKIHVEPKLTEVETKQTVAA